MTAVSFTFALTPVLLGTLSRSRIRHVHLLIHNKARAWVRPDLLPVMTLVWRRCSQRRYRHKRSLAIRAPSVIAASFI
jgi:hypothetical protein